MKNKRSLIFLLLPLIVTILGSCNALFMTDEARAMTGLWRSEGWDSQTYDVCYYDLRADGTAYVTEWTNDLEVTNNIIVPNYLLWSVKDSKIRFSQFMGIVNVEFEMTSVETDVWDLTVIDSSLDYIDLYYSNTFRLVRVMDYSREAEIVRTCRQESLNER